MRERSLEPDVISCSAAMAACAGGKQWRGHLSDMWALFNEVLLMKSMQDPDYLLPSIGIVLSSCEWRCQDRFAAHTSWLIQKLVTATGGWFGDDALPSRNKAASLAEEREITVGSACKVPAGWSVNHIYFAKHSASCMDSLCTQKIISQRGRRLLLKIRL